MTPRDLLTLGFQPGPPLGVALRLIPQLNLDPQTLETDLCAILKDPAQFKTHPHWSSLAEALMEHERRQESYQERAEPAPYRIWGQDLDTSSLDQMKNAARLPVAVSGALMPDAHQGYGLPIGGVLATDNTIIPYAVGVDIACRMKLSVLDIPPEQLKGLDQQLKNALERQTVFGTGGVHRKPLEHEVLADDWDVSPITRKFYEKAQFQLGTSGSGNHFVEFGILTVEPDAPRDAASTCRRANTSRSCPIPAHAARARWWPTITPSWR